MNDLIAEIQRRAGSDSSYVAECPVNIYPGYFEDEQLELRLENDTVPVQFYIELEAREWGIKDITVSIPEQQIRLGYELLDENDAVVKTGEIVFDPSKLTLMKSFAGSRITLEEINLHLNKDMGLSYEQSTIDVNNPF